MEFPETLIKKKKIIEILKWKMYYKYRATKSKLVVMMT